MTSPNHQITPAKLPDEDGSLSRQRIFSTRIRNALIRTIISSLRRLYQYSVDLLLQKTRNLGSKGVHEIQALLAQYSHSLAPQIAASPPSVAQEVPSEAAAPTHPEIADEALPTALPEPATDAIFAVDPDGLSADILLAFLHALLEQMHSSPLPSLPADPPAVHVEKPVIQEGKIVLSELWPKWIAALTDQQREILSSHYGLDGETPLNLQEIADELELSRARAHQIKKFGLGRLQSKVTWRDQHPLFELLLSAIQQADNLLTADEWQEVLDERTIWEADERRPSLLPLLCDMFGEFYFHHRYNVACPVAIGENLEKLHTLLKRILRGHKAGLTDTELISEIQNKLPPDLPSVMQEPALIRKAITLFDRIGQSADGRYHYLRKKREPLLPTTASTWLGKPETKLHEWECKLRQQIEKVAWIGQIALSEEEFTELCRVIQAEAQASNQFTKKSEGQPRLVPAAVFMTTMVFAARYSQQDADEFWVPYLQAVWNVPYTQAFMVRCTKRFNMAVAELGQAFKLEFPRGATGGVVAPTYRHALLPRYVQDDFAHWMRDKWREILPLADSPTLLVAKLQQDSSLEYLPQRLQTFILGKDTEETAADLIADMAAALSLYVNGGESIDSIREQLADSPIKQELWSEIAKAIAQELAREHTKEKAQDRANASGQRITKAFDDELAQPSNQEIAKEIDKAFDKIFDNKITQESDQVNTQPPSATLSPLRLSPPRIDWVWVVDEGELALRVQNIILPPNEELEGEANRLVWVESLESDPTDAENEVEVRPWVMKTGERVIQEVLIEGIEERQNGQIVLLTDRDEVATRLAVPPLPNRPVQFFRLTQQGAYGIPVDPLQVDNGVWLVCATQPLTFRDEENEVVEIDGVFPVPYPLHEQFRWAAQLSLTLPVTIEQGNKKIGELTTRGNQMAFAQPLLHGEEPIAGLSMRLQPTFSSTQISVTVDSGGERLVKQAALWLYGQDGWRWIRPLTAMLADRKAVLDKDSLRLDLGGILPSHPNVYALELRASLHPLLATPLYFAVLPGVSITYPAEPPLYTPATPFQIRLGGVDEAMIVPDGSMSLTSEEDETQQAPSLQITWHDLRHDPRLLLRWGNLEIPLLWSVARCMAWLEPKPTKAFLTLDELRQTTLHVVGKQMGQERFALSVTDRGKRVFSLKRGRSSIQIAQSQLFDMIRPAQSTHLQVSIEADNVTWHLFDVRQRPDLSAAAVEVDAQEPLLHFHTGLQKEWAGQGHFYVESLTNPFASAVALGDFERLTAVHQLPLASLVDDTYCLRLELDGAPLPLNEQATIFTVGRSTIESSAEEHPQDSGLDRLIRSGELIPERYANDFVLKWAMFAEDGKTELSPSTRYQLSTIHARALEFFDYPHLKTLWPALADLRAVHDWPRWFESYGLLPAWIVLPAPLLFQGQEHASEWTVYPIQVAHGGLEGKGYGPLFSVIDKERDEERKVQVYVQWQEISATHVHLEAGLPGEMPAKWSEVELDDTYSLFRCAYCGRLIGAMGALSPSMLPEELVKAHWHGREEADLRDINTPEKAGGYRFVVKLFHENRGRTLLDIFERYEVAYPVATSYLPEPAQPERKLSITTRRWRQLAALTNAFVWYGSGSEATSPWASVARLLNHWGNIGAMSDLGRSSIALGMMLRTAAYYPHRYSRLLKEAALTEADIQELLALINLESDHHLRWGLTWAELLFVHSPRYSVR
jgi:hypothetical protein